MILFIAFSLIHIGFFSWLLYHWKHLNPSAGSTVSDPRFFSVIVPIRDESTNLKKLLNDLEHQSYPLDAFEVIVVDDHSEDGSFELCETFFSTSPVNGQIIHLDKGNGKKAAITMGVNRAKGEVILTTDADCRLPEEWIYTYNTAYQQPGIKMLTGPVSMEGNSLFEKVQQYEFAALIGIGAASLGSGHPGMCNGANLSYKKEAFLEVNGYDGNLHIPSGDDEFLLQKLHNRYPEGVAFLKNNKATVTTRAKSSFKELLNQRIRWASKWKFHRSIYIRLMAVAFFTNYVILVWAFAVSFQSLQLLVLFLVVFLVRWLAVYRFTHSILQFFGAPRLFFPSLVGEIFYPLFVTFLGLASIFGKYSWKGRTYNDRRRI